MTPIIYTPNEVLVRPAERVGKIDSRVRKILAEMKEVLIFADNPKGVGLAAPQIGISLRIFIIRAHEKDPIRTFIDPVYIKKSHKLVKGIKGNRLEGCLSVPHVWGQVNRHEKVTIRYIDETGVSQKEEFLHFPATIVQHEMDHLDGILFTRRILEQKGTLYRPAMDAEGKEVLEPIDL